MAPFDPAGRLKQRWGVTRYLSHSTGTPRSATASALERARRPVIAVWDVQSCRRVPIGSTLAARKAGIDAATTQDVTMSTRLAAYATGS
jgi:hypothetical protein